MTPFQVLISFSQHLMILSFFIDHTGLPSVNIIRFRVATISLLIYLLIERKLNANYFDNQFIISVIFQENIADFSFLNVRIYYISLPFMSLWFEFLGFGLLDGQKKQLEDVLLRSGKLWWAFRLENSFIERNLNSCRPKKYLQYTGNLLWILWIGISPLASWFCMTIN